MLEVGEGVLLVGDVLEGEEGDREETVPSESIQHISEIGIAAAF